MKIKANAAVTRKSKEPFGCVLNLPICEYDVTAMTNYLLITSTMTAKPGPKELLLTGYTMAPGSKTPTEVQIEFPFNVTRR